jgi:hypothetical protein
VRNYLLFSFFLSGCSVLGHSGNEIPLFYLEKSACYGQCPVYKAEIYKSGNISFQGISNTKVKGHYCANIDKKNLEKLIEAFIQYNYLSFEDTYLSHAKDLPTTITGFNYQGRQKRVLDYDKAPAELKQLEKMLETLVDTTKWERCK